MAGNRGVRVVGLLCRRPDAGQTVGVLEDFIESPNEARLQWAAFDPALRKYIQLFSPITSDLPTKDIYVHAKLMMVDDTLVLLGSANIAFTSLEFHSEICALVEDRSRAKALRRSLFAEHLCLSEEQVPALFSEGADLWSSHAAVNVTLLQARQAPLSRVIPLSPLSHFERAVP
jgi:phosphatidylserine/phosphatidylglycerophosphate/cardiolipin synthase-like enzyme